MENINRYIIYSNILCIFHLQWEVNDAMNFCFLKVLQKLTSVCKNVIICFKGVPTYNHNTLNDTKKLLLRLSELLFNLQTIILLLLLLTIQYKSVKIILSFFKILRKLS